MRFILPINSRLAFAGVALVAATAHAQVHMFSADLSGGAESPPNASPGTGTAQVVFDEGAHTMRVMATFSDLLGTTTASHIHAATAMPGMGTAGVATQTPTFMNFPLGVTSGTYDMTFDMTMDSSYNPAFLTAHGDAAGAEAFLLQSMLDGTAYLNIHTSQFPGGEIRGFLVPAPGGAAALVLGAGLFSSRRRRA
jgi:hypothetical protein